MNDQQNKKLSPAEAAVASEHQTLDFWQANKIFEQSLEQTAPHGDYVFYDGPPFATGTPHYGHIVASVMKDAVPRYWTMKGYHVERKWGWDCHGLPIENIVEKELGFKGKKDIIEFGVDKFNEACRARVLTYVDEWQKTINRLGRWVDMEHAYKTMDKDFMESVWWAFGQLWDKGLVYEGYRSMHICPRCETTLSQSEVSEGYRDVKDLSCIAKFELVDQPGTFVLAWTTTPWTLIGNVALAVGSEIDYVLCHPRAGGDPDSRMRRNDSYIVAKARVQDIFKDQAVEITKEFKGADLVGKKYEPLFDYYIHDEKIKDKENGWQIYAADFVTTEDGTGVVHIAPAFGEDDLNLGKQYNLPFIQHVGMNGVIKPEAGEFAGLHVKPIDDHGATDVAIIKYLAGKNLLFAKAKYEHSYPFCWRCDTPLLNYATSSWFVDVTKIKGELLGQAETIDWSPAHIKNGRFGNWLEGARDWSISRQRFWASCLPIWRCAGKSKVVSHESLVGCGNTKVVGSVAELEKLSGQKIEDLHKDYLDKVNFACDKCGGMMQRVPDVLDCWFEAGSMPYGQLHYPFENKEKFEANFPAEFIAEGVDQTRCWFYYLHLLSVAINDTHAFNHVIVNGIVQAEDGKKMSKRLKNYPDPNLLLEKYGADALRVYLLSSPVMQAENLNFSEAGVADVLRQYVITLNNVMNFYQLYADEKVESRESLVVSQNILDQWIVALLEQLISGVTMAMDKYDLPSAVRPIGFFINEFSTWYIRRSRDRFKGDDEADKQAALATTKLVLEKLAIIIAPFMPFMAESIWQQLHDSFSDNKNSVHLQAWPKLGDLPEVTDKEALSKMHATRILIEKLLADRDKLKLKVRQPLQAATIPDLKLADEYLQLIRDEDNVKEIKFGEDVGHDTTMTDELKAEGAARDVVRAINALRKQTGLTIDDRITIYAKTDAKTQAWLEGQKNGIIKDTLAQALLWEMPDDLPAKITIEQNGQAIEIALVKL